MGDFPFFKLEQNELVQRTVVHRDYERKVERIDSVLISGACKVEKERLEMKFLKF
jgi:hypothetical protein